LLGLYEKGSGGVSLSKWRSLSLQAEESLKVGSLSLEVEDSLRIASASIALVSKR
jgi:hypothetical protein